MQLADTSASESGCPRAPGDRETLQRVGGGPEHPAGGQSSLSSHERLQGAERLGRHSRLLLVFCVVGGGWGARLPLNFFLADTHC